MARYQFKAAELGMSVGTLHDWLGAYKQEGDIGLLDGRHCGNPTPSAVWIPAGSTCSSQCSRNTRPPAALPCTSYLNASPPGSPSCMVPAPFPSPKTPRHGSVLDEITKGYNTIRGTTKQKRSIARPVRSPTAGCGRPGRASTCCWTPRRLDVFAMEPLTLRWVSVELTIALDLYTRCIAGLRLSPVSTKAVDAALVLYEAITPDSGGSTARRDPPLPGGCRPWCWWTPTGSRAAGLPGVDAETVVSTTGGSTCPATC